MFSSPLSPSRRYILTFPFLTSSVVHLMGLFSLEKLFGSRQLELYHNWSNIFLNAWLQYLWKTTQSGSETPNLHIYPGLCSTREKVILTGVCFWRKGSFPETFLQSVKRSSPVRVCFPHICCRLENDCKQRRRRWYVKIWDQKVRLA